MATPEHDERQEASESNEGTGGEFKSSKESRRGYVSGLTFLNKPVTYSIIDEDAIFEGDIVLGTTEEMEETKEAIEEMPEDGESLGRGLTITGGRYRWPNGIVPFVINDGLPNQQRVTDAIRHWEERTNLRFRRRTNENNFIEFVPGNGCSSRVGMIGGGQRITLGTNCTTGNTVHEIGHAIGLWHEMSREDRDLYVSIVLENIRAENRHNFNQHISDGDDVGPYDYGSVMHYPERAFAIDSSKPTILAPQPIGQRNGLSEYDIRTANTIYPRKTTLSDTSTNGPAFAHHDGRLLLGWTGTGNQRLNFVRSTNGTEFTDKVTLADTSPNALDLSVFRGRYVVAWTGTGNNRLNVMQSSDGRTWSEKVTLNETSESTPALTTFGPYLYLAWRGVGNNRLNVMRSTDGQNWKHKRTLSDTTPSGPSLAALNDRLLLAWRGVGNNQLNVMRSYNGTTFHGKVTLPETTLSKPRLSVHNGQAYLCWRGVGNDFLNLIPSRDGIEWHGKITSGETCIDAPTLGTVDPPGDDVRMLWGWTGTDRQHRLNAGLI